MDINEIVNHIKVIATPEPNEDMPVYWLHTMGMAKFEKPELELRLVPFPYVRDACALLNKVAAYTMNNSMENGTVFVDGPDTFFPVTYIAHYSEDSYWESIGVIAVDLMPVIPASKCDCCACGKETHLKLVDKKTLH